MVVAQPFRLASGKRPQLIGSYLRLPLYVGACYTGDRFRPRGRFLRTGNEGRPKTVVFAWSPPAPTTNTFRISDCGSRIPEFRIDQSQSVIRNLQSALGDPCALSVSRSTG